MLNERQPAAQQKLEQDEQAAPSYQQMVARHAMMGLQLVN
jgi:hypothetical protein